MKKRNMLLGIAALSSVFVTACGKKEEGEPYNLSNIIEQTKVETKVTADNPGVNKLVAKTTFSTDGTVKVINSNYANYGLLIVENANKQIGFYSLHYQKYLIMPQYQKEWLKYNIYTDSNLGYFVKINYQGVYHIYDSIGNEVYKSNDNIYTYGSSKIVNDEIYTSIRINAGKISYKHFKYLNNGKLEEVEKIPEIINETSESEKGNDLEFGDIYVSSNKIDLSKYGLNGKYLVKSNNNLYTVFNKSNSKLISFYIPTNSHYIIGNKIIYQITDTLADDTETYTYYNGTKKMDVKTYSVNLETGEESEICLPFVISGATIVKDNNNIYKYAVISAKKIKDNKILDTKISTLLIDSEGKVLEDLTGYEVRRFTKIGNNYYNQTTKVIYDSNLKEIAYIGYINPIHIKNANVFVGTDNKKYGAVDYNGKVVIPFKYDTLKPFDNDVDFLEEYLLGKIGDKYYRINKNTGVSTEIGENVQFLYEDLYLVINEEENKLDYINQKGTYVSIEANIDNVTSNTTNKMHLNSLLGEYVLTIVKQEREVTKDNSTRTEIDTTYITYAVSELNTVSTFESIGEEVTSSNEVGKSYTDAMNLSLGDNNINVYGLSNTYFEYTSEKTSDFTFLFKDKIPTNISIKEIEGENIAGTLQNSKNGSYVTVALEEGKKYYIILTFETNTTYTSLNLQEVVANN